MDLESMTQDEKQEAASKQGWREDGEKDAETFLKDGEEILSIKRERYNTLEGKFDDVTKELSSVKTELAGNKKTMEDFTEYHKGVSKREYDKAVASISSDMVDIKAAQTKAVEEADGEEYKRLDQRMAIKQQEISRLNTPMPQQNPQPKLAERPVFTEWKKTNPWYAENPLMSVQADSIAQRVFVPGMSEMDHYNAVGEVMKKEFPNKFDRPSGGSNVEGDSQVSSDASGGKKFSDLPSDAKAACDRFVKDMPGFTRKQYLESYEWE